MRWALALSTAISVLAACGDSSAPAPDVPNPIPRIEPSPTFERGGAAQPITVRGSNFVANSVVRVNGADRVTQFISSSELRASLTTDDAAQIQLIDITVFNPPPSGGTSNIVRVTIEAPVVLV